MYIKNRKLELVTQVIKNRVDTDQSTSILLTGVPGSGKTAFAKQLAEDLNAKFFRYDCNEESNSSLLCAYDLDGIIKREAAYIKGPLWEAFDEATPTVLLIDEIDKSPRDFEAFLLRTTDEQSFRSPKGEEVEAKNAVVFVFTSNGRRELSPEFQRRSMRVDVEYPKGKLLSRIIDEIVEGYLSRKHQNILVNAVDLLNGKVEPDELPSPKELAHLLSALTWVESKQDIEILLEAYFVKKLSLSELNYELSYDLAKRLWKAE